MEAGATPLHIASYQGHAAVVGLLFAGKGVEVNEPVRVASRHSPLTIAAFMGHARVCELLLRHGADSRYRAEPLSGTEFDTAGGTALDIAREKGQSGVVHVLR